MGDEEVYDPDAPSYAPPIPVRREPNPDTAPPQSENTRWDELRGVWVMTQNGATYVWDEAKQIYLPDVRRITHWQLVVIYLSEISFAYRLFLATRSMRS